MGGGRRDGRARATRDGRWAWLRAVRVFFIEKRTLAIEVGAGKQKSRPVTSGRRTRAGRPGARLAVVLLQLMLPKNWFVIGKLKILLQQHESI